MTTTIALGVPYKDAFSIHNTKVVLDAVRQRFPDWVDRCEPYVNVLTLRAWNQRGYRVKKGEKAIRVFTKAPVTETDPKTGEKKVVGARPATAFVFALPQVEKREAFPARTRGPSPAPTSAGSSASSPGTPGIPTPKASTSATSGTTSASSMP